MAEQLGYCDSQQFLAAHTKCDECVNWRPIKSAPAPSPASEQDEMERARSFRRQWSKTGDVEADAEMLYAFATQERASERKRVLEEACKAVCRLCQRDVELVGIKHRLRDGMVPKGVPYREVICAAAAIRKLEESRNG